MGRKITSDGELWYEITEEQFEALLADETKDYWVDLYGDGDRLTIVTLGFVRALRKQALEPPEVDWSRPTTLYGLPVIYSDEVEN